MRDTRIEGLEYILEAEADPDNRPFIVPWPRERHLACLVDTDVAHQVAENDQGAKAGFAIIAGLADTNRSVELRRVVVTDKRKGYGRAIVRAVTKFAFEVRSAHRLWLDVKEHNIRARRLYESEGFTEEGALRQCVRVRDEFESLVVMSKLIHKHQRH